MTGIRNQIESIGSPGIWLIRRPQRQREPTSMDRRGICLHHFSVITNKQSEKEIKKNHKDDSRKMKIDVDVVNNGEGGISWPVRLVYV